MKKVKLSTLGSLVKNNQRVQEYRLYSELVSESWCRIGEMSFNSHAIGHIVVGNRYIGSLPGSAAFYIGRKHNDNTFHLLYRSGGLVSKVRIVKTATLQYIELYIGETNPKGVTTAIHVHGLSLENIILYNGPVAGEIPAGASVLEYSL